MFPNRPCLRIILLVSLVLSFWTVPSRAQVADGGQDRGDAGARGLAGVDARPGVRSATDDAGALGNEPAQTRLRVGVVGSPPFVLGGDEPSGLSIEVWQVVANEADLEFDFVPVESVDLAIDEVAGGRLDVIAGPISITSERASRVRFTQPYYQATLAILAPPSLDLWHRVKPFLSKAFLAGLGALIIVLLIVGTLLWLAERRGNPDQFPRSPLGGIGAGVWLALVTMTTVGYGDRVPRTVAGRFVAGVWMLIALLSFSSLTAGIASTLTLTQLHTAHIDRAEELAGKRVAVVKGTTGAAFAKKHNARVLELEAFDDAVNAVANGQASAFVFDRPALRYHLHKNPMVELTISRSTYEPQGYGFVIRDDANLQRRINVALLSVGEAGLVETIADKWMGGASSGE